MALTVGTTLIYLVMLFLLQQLPISGATAASYESWFFLKDLPIFAFGAICFFIVRDASSHVERIAIGRWVCSSS